MSAVRKNMQSGLNARAPHSKPHLHTAIRRDVIIAGMNENRWRRVFINRQFGCKIGFIGKQIRRIHKDAKVRAATDFICDIHFWISAFAMLGHEGSGEVAACRKP